MRALVLNLAAKPERLAFQVAQLDRLGLAWDRIEAVTPEAVSPPMSDPYWSRWQRPLRPAEAAALLTHAQAWRRVAEGDRPCLVLEDDAVLMPAVPAFLVRIEALDAVDHVSLEVRGRRKLMGKRHPDAPMRRLWQDRTGAAAYALWPRGARILLARLGAAPSLADGAICAAYAMASWQADPALAAQIDICARYGVPTPIETVSSIDGATRSDPRGLDPAARWRFRARRISAQARMGLRRLAHPLARRREPALDRVP